MGKSAGSRCSHALPFPHQPAGAVDLADHVGVHGLVLAVRGAAGHAGGKALGHQLAGGVQQVPVGQPLRVVVVGRVLVAPDHLARGRDLVEIAAVPHGPGRVAIGRIGVVAVVAQVAVGQDHRVPARAHRQLPLVRHLAFDVHQVDVAVRRLRRDQRVAPGRQRGIMGDEADAAAALRDLVDGAGHGGRFPAEGKKLPEL